MMLLAAQSLGIKILFEILMSISLFVVHHIFWSQLPLIVLLVDKGVFGVFIEIRVRFRALQLQLDFGILVILYRRHCLR